MEKNNKFTVISSCYNKGRYLKSCLESVCLQKYRPLELIVANDCSTDNSRLILDSFTSIMKSNNIDFKIINNPTRLSCGSSYHNLVRYITGAYVGVLDSDDMLEHDAVEYIMNLYSKYPEVGWIYTQFDLYSKDMVRRRKGFCQSPSEGESLLDLGNRRVHGYGHWRTFNYKINNPKDLFGEGLICSVDKYMGYKLEETSNGLFVDRVCYKYRCHPVGSNESVSSTKLALRVWEEVRKEAGKRRSNGAFVYKITSVQP